MSERGALIAAAALDLVGTPFRLHGRDTAGLDCVGLVLAALRAGRSEIANLSGYELRQRDVSEWLDFARRNGLEPVEGSPRPGDVVLVQSGPAQHHLLVASSAAGFVHAHAGLRRVVHSPAPLPCPVLRHWRLMD